MPRVDREKYNAYKRELYKRNAVHRKKHKQRVSKNNKQRIAENYDFVRQYKQELGCKICRETEPCCLSFHHLKGKKGHVSEMIGRACSLKTIKKEIAKCVVLCENCHRKIHAGILNLTQGGLEGPASVS